MIAPRSIGRRVWLAVVAFALGAGGCGGDDQSTNGGSGYPAKLVAEGRAAYNETCAMCHGPDLRGTSMGPSFLDVIYAPNHHPDASFRAAAEQGVQAHHWNFGDMPAQPQISEEEIDAIIAYVRTTQQDEGITRDPSHG